MKRNIFLALLSAIFVLQAQATDIDVVGLFPGKAVLVVDGGAPRTYSVGATVAPGIRLVAAGDAGATLDFNGKRKTVAMGQHAGNGGGGGDGGSATLRADGRGHFTAEGQINGAMVRMLVDTGASIIAIPASDASRLGLSNYRSGTPSMVSTANGATPAYRVKLDSVKVGSIVIHQVEGVVIEQGLPTILLGMSFLNRTEMQRNGDTMTLKKRF